jgi:hypothetical protein
VSIETMLDAGDEIPPGGWVEPERTREAPRPGIALAIVCFGIVAEMLVRGGPGVGYPLIASAGMLLLAALARPRAIAYLHLTAALLLTWFIALRSSPTMIALDLAGAGALAAVGASYARAGDPRRAGVHQYAVRGLSFPAAAPAGIVMLLRPLAAPGARVARSGAALRMALIVVPVVGAFAVLLATADPVFAHLIGTRLDPDVLSWAPSHLLLAAACSGVAAVLVRLAITPVEDTTRTYEGAGLRLARREWMLLVGCVDLLFATFMIVQLSTLFGGQRHVLEEVGLTYATYARTGFAQMVVAASLTLLLIAVVWTRAERSRGADDLLFSTLAGTLLLLAVAVLASAFRRLVLYEEAYGFTSTRLYVHAFILWLALVLACALVAVATRRAAWIVNAAVGLGLIALVTLNVMDPDAFVARRDLDRFRSSGKLDIAFLGTLSADAVPTLVSALPSLPAEERALMRTTLACRWGAGGQSDPWTAWNLGRSRARAALMSAGLANAVCGAEPLP